MQQHSIGKTKSGELGPRRSDAALDGALIPLSDQSAKSVRDQASVPIIRMAQMVGDFSEHIRTPDNRCGHLKGLLQDFVVSTVVGHEATMVVDKARVGCANDEKDRDIGVQDKIAVQSQSSPVRCLIATMRPSSFRIRTIL